jgi:hypothetical protein
MRFVISFVLTNENKQLRKNTFLVLLLLLSFPFFSNTFSSLFADDKGSKKNVKIVYGCPAESISEFEEFVKQAKGYGATHIQIQAEDLPFTWWQMDTPGDPYPAWVITNPGLLKTFIPKLLKKSIPDTDAKKIVAILKSRCAVLRKYGLKAAFHSFEPQMLPEQVFLDHPERRGPRVDHPLRSRVKRYAPSIENPDILALYKESVHLMLEQCPEIEILEFRTNDSGAGISWSNGLYAGPNGNSIYKDVGMEKRLGDFFESLQIAANASGKNLDIHLYNTKESDPGSLVKRMHEGEAIDNYEQPGNKFFKNSVGSLLYYRRAFSPVKGIPWPVTFLEELENSSKKKSSRLFISIGDRLNKNLYFKIIKQFKSTPTTDEISRLQLLKKIAASESGEKLSSTLLDVWLNLNRVEQIIRILDTGGTMLILGGIHERWITRPLVPFPAELKQEEKDYYRRFQFQARTEKDADNLIDMQAGREFEGWNGRWFVNRIIEMARSNVMKARNNLVQLVEGMNDRKKEEYRLMNKRLEAYILLLNNAGNIVSYQAQLDRIFELKNRYKAEEEFKNNIDNSIRSLLTETAKGEIDNTNQLIELLKSEKPNEILDLAKTKNEEYQRQLGPDIADQLQKKVNIMKAHQDDYKKLFKED